VKIPVETLPESEQYQRVLDPSGSVSWMVASDPGGACKADAGAPELVRQAVEEMGQDLAAIDYAGLSLPRFVTVTRGLKLDATSWNDGELGLEACGSEGGKLRWQLFGVQGPEFDQLPDLTLVHRWPHVYALYDIDSKVVTRLLATIRGYVLE
jgi:hypothetical protein